MKWKVTLYNSGQLIEEILIARDSKEAERGALNRNPGSTVYSTTGYFLDDTSETTPKHNESGSYSSPSSSQSTRISVGGGVGADGIFVLSMIAIAVILFIEFTPYVLMGVLGLLGAWIGKKSGNVLITFVLILGLGGYGFYLGSGLSEEINDNGEDLDRPAGTEVNRGKSGVYFKDELDKQTPSLFESSELTKEEKDCLIWRNAFPAHAAKLKQGEVCYK